MSILLVDDSAFQRAALAATLKREGHTALLMAASALEAFAHLEKSTPRDIDLILMDVDMPDMNGIEATRRIKAMPGWEDVPIIMVTGRDEAEDLKLAFAAGANDYMTKPPNEVELVARLRSAMKLKQEMDQRKARELDLREANERLDQLLNDLADKHILLQSEQEKSEMLLLNILPKPIADRLKREQGVIADRFDDVTVLFADIVNFTTLSTNISPEELVTLLNKVFSIFDRLADQYGLEKIKTTGDAYMAVGGLPTPRADHAEASADLALAIQRELEAIVGDLVQVRIGLHTGPVVAGVIGTKKFIYDIWGDTVNIASRMEAQGTPGRIQVTAATYARLGDLYQFEERGSMNVKGKGEMITYFLMGKK